MADFSVNLVEFGGNQPILLKIGPDRLRQQNLSMFKGCLTWLSHKLVSCGR
jgi:hypothetical protein